LDKLHDPTTDPDEYTKAVRRIGGWFDGAGSSKFLRSPEDVLRESKKNRRERIARYRTGVGIYPYGIEGLDFYDNGQPRLIPGTAPAKSTLVVGESGSGKTTMSNRIVLAQMAQKRVVMHGGWEMFASENLELFAALSLGFSRSALFIGNMTDEEMEAIDAEEERILSGDHPYLKFMDRPFDRERKDPKGFDKRRGNEWNLDTIHEHIEASGADVAVFDLFHKALVETKPDDEKRALDRIQGIADATKAHLILLHHVNKEDMDKSPGRVPTRKAIKGSSAWLDAVDTVLATYVPGTVKGGVIDTFEVFVLKQRYGKWPLRVAFDYDPDTGSISGGRDVEAIPDEESIDADIIGAALNGGKRR
jgi:archaellum biogenesis ATPase FlaH